MGPALVVLLALAFYAVVAIRTFIASLVAKRPVMMAEPALAGVGAAAGGVRTIAPKDGPGTKAWNWLTETQVWTSVFRHERPNSDRNRVLVMLSNVFLHLHPVRIRKSGVKLRYTWCMGGLSFFLFLVLTFT